MSLNAAMIEVMVAKGLTAEDILDVARASEKKADRTNAERQARYRTRRKRNAVTVTNSPPIDNTHTPLSSNDENTPARKPKQVGPAKPDGVTEQTWSDFTAHRKARKAPVNETVLAGIRREAEKAGWTLDAALAEVVTRGWQSFKAEWVAKDTPRAAANDPGGFLAHVLERQQRREQQAGGP